jgi:hypothetical protein
MNIGTPSDVWICVCGRHASEYWAGVDAGDLRAGSIALLADAGHNLGDALVLVPAWGGYVLVQWRPTER